MSKFSNFKIKWPKPAEKLENGAMVRPTSPKLAPPPPLPKKTVRWIRQWTSPDRRRRTWGSSAAARVTNKPSSAESFRKRSAPLRPASSLNRKIWSLELPFQFWTTLWSYEADTQMYGCWCYRRESTSSEALNVIPRETRYSSLYITERCWYVDICDRVVFRTSADIFV